ncbi:MAG TPA: hypothetical protein VN737_23095 [Bryobacteraceae bacterium]|nr:hypothetical protein [Bryobacteraceae bacterium]
MITSPLENRRGARLIVLLPASAGNARGTKRQLKFTAARFITLKRTPRKAPIFITVGGPPDRGDFL